MELKQCPLLVYSVVQVLQVEVEMVVVLVKGCCAVEQKMRTVRQVDYRFFVYAVFVFFAKMCRFLREKKTEPRALLLGAVDAPVELVVVVVKLVELEWAVEEFWGAAVEKVVAIQMKLSVVAVVLVLLAGVVVALLGKGPVVFVEPFEPRALAQQQPAVEQMERIAAVEQAVEQN